jgi:hypothetical protein
MEEIEFWLHRYINTTTVWPDGTVLFIKQQMGQVRNMKIEMYANDHNPPHFHVKSRDGSIDAVFSLNEGCYIEGKIDSKDQKRILAFYHSQRDNLLDFWKKNVSKLNR